MSNAEALNFTVVTCNYCPPEEFSVSGEVNLRQPRVDGKLRKIIAAHHRMTSISMGHGGHDRFTGKMNNGCTLILETAGSAVCIEKIIEHSTE